MEGKKNYLLDFSLQGNYNFKNTRNKYNNKNKKKKERKKYGIKEE